jgi:hypothetical protein
VLHEGEFFELFPQKNMGARDRCQISNILKYGENWLLVLKLLSKIWSNFDSLADFRPQGSVDENFNSRKIKVRAFDLRRIQKEWCKSVERFGLASG